jgi:AcrR family transcriptional regulator
VARVAAAPRPKRKSTDAVKPTTRKRGPLGTFFARNEILAGAAAVFAAKGATEATVEDILRASRISRRTFYRFFGSKDDVLEALHEVACQLFVQAIEAALAERGTAAERLERCIDVYLGFGQRQGPLMAVLQGESQRPDSPLATRRTAVIDALVALLGGAVKGAHDRAIDPLVFRGLLFALEGMNRLLLEKGALAPGDAARAKKAMMRILGATLATGWEAPPLPLVDG